MKRGWMISPFDQISIFDLKLEKWPFGVKFLWRLKGRQTYLEWFGIPNVVEWYPFRPGFNLILKNGRKSYLGLPTVENFFFEPYSEQPWDTMHPKVTIRPKDFEPYIRNQGTKLPESWFSRKKSKMLNTLLMAVLLMPGMNRCSRKRKILPDCAQVISIIVHCGRHIIYNDTINRIH